MILLAIGLIVGFIVGIVFASAVWTDHRTTHTAPPPPIPDESDGELSRRENSW